MKIAYYLSFLMVIVLACSVNAQVICNDDAVPKAPVFTAVNPAYSSQIQGTLKTPGSLTTIFAANGGYRGNMFDIVPQVPIEEITGVDVNVDPAGYQVTVDVYWREDTCVGHDMDPAGWYLLGSATTTAAGLDLPTFIDLHGNGVSFDADHVYGMYVDVSSYSTVGINYTNGGPNTYANTDLELTTYYGKGTPAFTGSSFYPRIWNGTIYYEAGLPNPLSIHPDTVSAWYGGSFELKLFGDGLGNRPYALFGTQSGSIPGTGLPGGLVLPINWDWFTEVLMVLTLTGSPLTLDFLGTLDADGYATATLTVPGHWHLVGDLAVKFAWCTYNPFDFVSNDVDATIIGTPPPPTEYQYDDGSTENGLGLTAGGQTCWMHWFEVIPGAEKLNAVSTAFGSVGGSNPPAGTPAAVYIWNDPNNDGDPSDAELLVEVASTVQDPGTDTFIEVDVGIVEVTGGFFIGAMCEHLPGVYPGPMDENFGGGTYNGHAWVVGDTTYNFNPHDLLANDVPPVEVGSVGFPAFWLLRAPVEH